MRVHLSVLYSLYLANYVVVGGFLVEYSVTCKKTRDDGDGDLMPTTLFSFP